MDSEKCSVCDEETGISGRLDDSIICDICENVICSNCIALETGAIIICIKCIESYEVE